MALEIERKFLLDGIPPEIRGALRYADLEQIYLTDGSRIRRMTDKNGTRYIRTVKIKLSAMTHEETENDLTEASFAAYARLADPSRVPIRKRRYYYPYDGHVFEIDDFTELGFVMMEVELGSENEAVHLPPCLTVLDEVTYRPEYRNAELAKKK